MSTKELKSGMFSRRIHQIFGESDSIVLPTIMLVLSD
jgi:hypothetical protein